MFQRGVWWEEKEKEGVNKDELFVIMFKVGGGLGEGVFGFW